MTPATISAVIDRLRAEAGATGCTGPCDQGRAPCTCKAPAPAEACTEVGADSKGRSPVTGAAAVRFWLVISAPAFVGVVGYALIVWWAKP